MSEPDVDPPSSPVSVFSSGRRMLTTGLILTITLVAFESLAIATVMPRVEEDLGDLPLYGWVFSAFFLGSLVGIVAAGRLADRVHPAVPFAAGLAVFGLGLLIGGTAPSMLILVGGRLLQGLGGGAIPAVTYVCIGRAYPQAVRPRMFALLSTAWIVPALVGPKVAETIADLTSWHWVFLGLLPLMVFCGGVALLGLRSLDGPDPTDTPPASLRDAVLVAGGAGIVLWSLDRSVPASVIAAAVVGFAIAIPALRRLTPAGTLRAAPGLPSAVVGKGIITFTFFSADAYVPLAFETVRETSGAAILTAGALFWAAGSWTQERFVGRVGPRRMVTMGFALLAVGICSTAAVLFTSAPVALAVVTWGVAGFGIGSGYAPLALAVFSEADPGDEGAVTSSMQLCDTLGAALGTGTAGALVALAARSGWSDGSGIALVYGLAFAAAVIGLVVSRGLPATLKHRTDPGLAAHPPG